MASEEGFVLSPAGTSNPPLSSDGEEAPLADFLQHLWYPTNQLSPDGNSRGEDGFHPSHMPLGAALNIPLPEGGSL